MKKASKSDFNLHFVQANYRMAVVNHVLQVTDKFFKTHLRKVL